MIAHILITWLIEMSAHNKIISPINVKLYSYRLPRTVICWGKKWSSLQGHNRVEIEKKTALLGSTLSSWKYHFCLCYFHPHKLVVETESAAVEHNQYGGFNMNSIHLVATFQGCFPVPFRRLSSSLVKTFLTVFETVQLFKPDLPQ